MRVGEVWGETAALVHPGLQGSCGDFVFLTARKKKKKRRQSISVNQSFHLTLPCAHCTYMTCTTTPMPDTASLSTAFSIAWEMVSNRSSGSCMIKHIFRINSRESSPVARMTDRALYKRRCVSKTNIYSTNSINS